MAEAIKLNIDTGRKEFNFNDKITVAFNPTDSLFAGKVFETYKDIQEHQDAWKSSVGESDDPIKKLKEAEKEDAYIREKIDALFGCEFCEAICPKDECFMFSIGNGFPIWMNVMESIMDVMDESMLKEQNLSKERIKKYTSKYRKK